MRQTEARQMPDSALEKDNLFQLNTLVWASFPQPFGAPVTPVLRNAGYTLYAIEKPLEASVAEKAQLNKSTLDIGHNPTIDVVLSREKFSTYILVECKPSSFGLNSDWTSQARGLIVAGGSIASRLGVSGESTSEICYLVPVEDTQSTDVTLVELYKEMSIKGLKVCPTGVIGISVKSDGAYLGLPNRLQGTALLPLTLVPERKVLSVSTDQDPRPLYVIPWIPDAQDSNDLEAFKEKIRAKLLSWLGKAAIGGSGLLYFEELLNDVSRGVFQYWGDKSSLFGRVFPTVEKLVRIFFGDDTRVSIRRREVTVTLKLQKDREELMEHVRTVGLPEKLPEGVQLQLNEQPKPTSGDNL
jgi:hypothetical protein